MKTCFKVIALALLAVLIKAVDIVCSDSVISIFCDIAELIIIALIVYIIYMRFEEQIKKLLNALFKALRLSILDFSKRKSSYTRRSLRKGRDEIDIVFNFDFNKKIREVFHIKQKLKSNNNMSEREKIRYEYIRCILTLAESGVSIKSASTPYEILYSLSDDELKQLFDSYVDARYTIE